MKKLLLSLLTLGTVLGTQAKIGLPAVFADNMVFQQQSDVCIWGTATPNRKVVIRPSWSRQAVTVRSDRDGRWSASVATPRAGGPYSISLSDGEKLTLNDVLIGEVWFCSGQSNMEMPMKGFPHQPVTGASDVIMRAKAATPIRICEVQRSTSRTPQSDCSAVWQRNTPEAVAGTSATAYYFAQYLHEVLGVPVGIIASSWGGTPVEAWMNRKAMAEFKEFDLSYLDTAEALEKPHYKPCMLYNAMIAPIAPYTVKGFLWYQGEANRLKPAQYRTLMPAFVGMLREEWEQGELPFYYVQIAPFRYENPDEAGSALLREAQLQNLEDIPSSGMAVTMDIASLNCIHPAQKQQVGMRLAWLALTKTYGRPGIEAEAPVYESMTVANGKARLTFRVGKEGLAPLGETLTGFEIAGADRIFYPATARIEKNRGRLVVTSEAVAEPVAVRYGFKNYAEATLFNGYGIPASSFRTDDWEVE